MGSMIANLAVNIGGSLIFLFLYWKKLKEDHVAETIFASGYMVVGGIFAAYFLAFKFFPGWIFWTEILAIFLAFSFGVYKFKMRPFETLDGLIVSLLPWFSLSFLKDSVVNSSLNSFISFVAVLIFIFIFYFLDMRYKKFTWYKSGKIGFSGLATLSVFFLTRASTSLKLPHMLTSTSTYGSALKAEPYLSGTLVLLSILGIFYL